MNYLFQNLHKSYSNVAQFICIFDDIHGNMSNKTTRIKSDSAYKDSDRRHYTRVILIAFLTYTIVVTREFVLPVA